MSDRPAPALREIPFQPGRTFVDEEAVDRALGLPALWLKATEMRSAFLANLLLAEVAGRVGIHYSRDRGYYSEENFRFYAPPCATNQAMVEAIKSLVDAGLAQEERVRPGSSRQRRSLLVSVGGLAESLKGVGRLTFRQKRRLHLKDENGKRIAFQSDGQLSCLEDDIFEHAAFTEPHVVALASGDVFIDIFGILRGTDQPLVAVRDIYRVFNGDFDHGGRLYGGWWLAIPRQVRANIRINGQPTTEKDYACCHPRLLAAMSGQLLGAGDDVYDVRGGFLRQHVKVGFNALLNADSFRGAVMALAVDLRERGIPDAFRVAGDICAAICDAHPETAEFFGTGVGLRLQRIDSDICMSVLRQLRRKGIPALSVHDSFLVPRQHEAVLADIMDEEFALACRRLKKS